MRHSISLACSAMATRFELVLHGDDEINLRAAGEEAIGEIQRVEEQLSLYRPTSEIATANARAAEGPVRLSPPVFHLLQRAQKLSQDTDGAFDITIAPLVRCGGFMGGTGHLPTVAEIAEARSCVGMALVHLDTSNFTIQFARKGVMIDLGAIGKGYAVECAIELLREAGVTSALLHAGTSTAYALGHPSEETSWKVGLDEFPVSIVPEPIALPNFSLQDEAMSVSAIWGRSFQAEGKLCGHVIDPRTGEPVNRAVLAAVVLPSATETDALSTALLTLGPKGHDQITKLRSEARTLTVGNADSNFRVETRG